MQVKRVETYNAIFCYRNTNERSDAILGLGLAESGLVNDAEEG